MPALSSKPWIDSSKYSRPVCRSERLEERQRPAAAHGIVLQYLGDRHHDHLSGTDRLAHNRRLSVDREERVHPRIECRRRKYAPSGTAI